MKLSKDDTNIEKHKKTQKREKTFEVLFERSPDGISIIEDGNFVQCNQKIVDIFKYDSKKELLNIHPSELSPKYQPDGENSFDKANEMMRLALSNDGHSFEWMHTRADGENFYAEIVLTPISLFDRDVIHVVWRDISLRKEMETKLEELNTALASSVKKKSSQLRKREELLSAIFEQTSEGIAILDLELNFTLVNSAFEKMTGFTKEKLYETSCRDLTLEEYIKESEEINEIVLKTGKYIGFEKKCMKKDGTIFDVSINIILMPDKKSFLVTSLDVTEENISKKEKVLQEEQMLKQSRLAQMGEMISMIAHQWRQPLGAISATAANLEIKFELQTFRFDSQKNIEKSSEYIVESLKDIDELVESLTTTIDDFRNFYKPNKKSVKISLEEVISKALKILSTSFTSSGIEVVQECLSKETMEIYDTELMQVILNILNNAKDNFIEKETKNPKILIKTYGKSISISDNGGGIDNTVLDKIFDPYFSTKDAKNGTGLGLYMSKIIVQEHHNGQLNAKNTKDGVCFTIDLNKEDK
ncbi:MAG: PAS domain S-box protein [Sulfurimonas sp.]|nr:PAS domain S-box protein [Sulfurimonas sp.]